MSSARPLTLILAWIFIGLAALGALIFVGWAQRAGSDLALLSSLEAGRTFLLLQNAFEGRAIFQWFNLPLLSLGTALVWLAGLTTVGRFVLDRVGPSAMNTAERWAFSFATGFLAVGLLVFLLGLAGGARPWVMGIVLALLGVAALASHRSLLQDLRSLPPVWRSGSRPLARNIVAVALLLLAIFAVLIALTPPIQSDGMRYHLGAPQEFLKAGRILYLPSNAFSNFPFLPEMHYLIALGVGAPEASQLMHLLCMFAVAVALIGAIMRYVEPLSPHAPGWALRAVPVLIVFGMPASFITATWPFVDHAVALFFVLTLFALLRAMVTGRRGDYLLLGAMAAGALGCKYTAVVWLAALALLAVWNYFAFAPPVRRGERRSFNARHFLLAFLAMAALSSPWFLKNLAFTGNPVYPLAHTLFGGGEWSAESARFLAERMSDKGEPATVGNIIPTLTRVAFQWPDYEGHNPGPLWFVLLAFGFAGVLLTHLVHGSRTRPLWLIAAAAALAYFMWYFTYQSNRMLVLVALLLAPLTAAFVNVAWRSSKRAGQCALLLLFFTSAYGALWTVQYTLARAVPPAAPYLAGAMSHEEYLARALSYQRGFQWLNEKVKPDERVLFVGEHRIYGARFKALWSDWFDAPVFANLARQHAWKTPDDFFDFAGQNGIAYIFMNNAELAPQEKFWRSRFSAEEWQLLQDVLASPRLKATKLPPGVTVYKIEPNP
ncbi:hypothetical protein CVU37_14210 [candidate division BRC1 bacterium HGW-BRC1-1]|jgi:hypothetical protein|nr:MAG: hypothetical protein CVU37_14210 [candidate division BRC1 bacterium HGW-BRC1-1]